MYRLPEHFDNETTDDTGDATGVPSSDAAPDSHQKPTAARGGASDVRCVPPEEQEHREKDGDEKKDGDQKADAKKDDAKKDGDAKDKKPTKKHLGWLYVVCGVLVVAAALGAGLITWRHHRREQRQTAALAREADKGPRVAVTKVQPGMSDRTLVLPADARAVVQTTVYAKTSGYVREIRVDKGDHVKKGDVLATVESPETDQQVVSAKADLNLKDKLAIRAHALVEQGLLSTQDRETADANQEVSRANLKRSQALADYETIRAPFDGIVSARYVDPGVLLPAATGSTQSALPLVDIVDPNTLRATVFLGQDVAPFVHLGDAVELWQDERPEQKVAAKLTRFASSLDPKTRTMLAEINFDNRPVGVLPGTFMRVSLKIKVAPFPTVPSDALFVRKGNLMIGKIEGDQLHFVPVVIGVNTGKTTQVVQGVTGGEDIALDVPAEVDDGAKVQVVQAPPPPAPSGSASAGPAGGPPAPASSGAH